MKPISYARFFNAEQKALEVSAQRKEAETMVVIDNKHLPIGQTCLRDVLQRLNKF